MVTSAVITPVTVRKGVRTDTVRTKVYVGENIPPLIGKTVCVLDLLSLSLFLSLSVLSLYLSLYLYLSLPLSTSFPALPGEEETYILAGPRSTFAEKEERGTEEDFLLAEEEEEGTCGGR